MSFACPKANKIIHQEHNDAKNNNYTTGYR
ncbi:Uncharacterised protein [Serratia grimesii]|nr:Uncharacterised protein [Serratia grimesii]CAI0829002.1 Uncharacterised protein [Serratia grimesii]CAI2449223.1 Uncharacterised protein [Serratia grimesii]CAI2785289.1 Uncharacterised protein [Serratia grimesii]CUW11295.1 Uncharacterised protein [Serratia grimesii]